MNAGQIVILVIVIIAVIAWMAWRLYRYSTRIQRRLKLLMDALDAGDTSLRFTETTDVSVNKMLNSISSSLSALRRKAIEKDLYYETILKDIATGVLVFDTDGYVECCNSALLVMLDRPVVNRLSAIRKYHPALVDFLVNSKPGDSSQVGTLSVRVSSFTKGDGKELRIATFDDISSSLEGKSVEAWVDMSRVLTHEIMNGIAPVLSISDSLRMRYKGGEKYVIEGLKTISESSEGLKRFVERYNMVTRVAEPEKERFDLVPLVESCVNMLCADSGRNVRLKKPVVELCVCADRGQIQQVLVNIIKNAIETDARDISVSCGVSHTGVAYVMVEDDGTPIPSEIAERIFTPFFTTKQNGSGIGLSLSRRIMMVNGGTLSLMAGSSTTRFVMSLPSVNG